MGGGPGQQRPAPGGQRPPSWQPTGGSSRPAQTRAQAGARAGGGAGGTRSGNGGRRSAGRTPPPRKKRLIDYPRHDKTGFRRWIPSWRLVLGTFLTFLALAVAALFIWYARTDIPTPADFVDAQTTTVYYADGETEMGTFGVQNRVLVDGEDIPEHVRWAFVAAEDRTFYDNPGINPAGIVRALFNNLTGGSRQGGSSITQQYAERYYHNTAITSYQGKLNEAMLAVKLARDQDKDQILANYLNTIYFGRDSYGIETAAQSYFEVGVADLTVSQAALIAGIIPSPNNWDPRVSPENAERRWNYVLDGMVAVGALTQAERDAQSFPETSEYSRSDTFAGPPGYLLDMVRREIIANSPITDEELDYNGYRIVTTIDPDLQDLAVEAAEDTLPEDRPENLRVGLVTLDRQSGAILALYGGPDYLTVSRNAVTQDSAQAGSTFKPFTLVAYLEQGGSLRSRYNGNSMVQPEGWDRPVRNFGSGNGQNFGDIDVVTATANSVNTVYAEMNVEVGPAETVDAAIRAGIPESVLEGQEVPANVLGTASPHPLDMAQAYNTFAHQGLRNEPYLVESVEYLSGGLVYSGANDAERIFDAEVMADTTYALTQVVEQGTARGAQQVGHPVAGKTGTSTDNRSAWFVGYSMHMTTAVALYQPGEDEEGRSVEEPITPFGGVSQVTGGSHPLSIWTAFMTPAHEGREIVQFPPRADIGEPNTPPMVEVPSVVGMVEAEAVRTLESAGFEVDVSRENHPDVPEGNVISQSPDGGAEAEQGSGVSITVSEGSGTVEVPNVVGRQEEAARNQLRNAGFEVDVQYAENAEVPAGVVVSQNPGGGQAEPGSRVTIVVSTGPPEEPDPEPEPEDPEDPGLGGGPQPPGGGGGGNG